MGRINPMQPEERFTRNLLGIIMIVTFFFDWGRWVALALGFLFLISAWQGYCFTCEIYKKLNQRKS